MGLECSNISLRAFPDANIICTLSDLMGALRLPMSDPDQTLVVRLQPGSVKI